MTLRIK